MMDPSVAKEFGNLKTQVEKEMLRSEIEEDIQMAANKKKGGGTIRHDLGGNSGSAKVQGAHGMLTGSLPRALRVPSSNTNISGQSRIRFGVPALP